MMRISIFKLSLSLLLISILAASCGKKEKDWRLLSVRLFAQKTNYSTEVEIKNILVREVSDYQMFVSDVAEESYLTNITLDYILDDTLILEYLLESKDGGVVDSIVIERLRNRIDEYIAHSYFSEDSTHTIERTSKGLRFRVALKLYMPSDKLYTFLEAVSLE